MPTTDPCEATLRELLDKIARIPAHGPNERIEAMWEDVAAVASLLPPEGIVAAIDRAVGRSARRARAAPSLIAMFAKEPAASARIGAYLGDEDPDVRVDMLRTIAGETLLEHVDAVARLAKRDPDPDVRKEARYTLEMLRSADARSGRPAAAGSPSRESLLEAVGQGRERLVRTLLGLGPDRDDVDAALISAVIHNQPQMVRLLLDAGASPRYRERLFGRTAFDYVRDETDPSILDMLRSV